MNRDARKLRDDLKKRLDNEIDKFAAEQGKSPKQILHRTGVYLQIRRPTTEKN